MRSFAERFLHDEGGATAIEYGLIVCAISIVVIGAVTAAGKNLYNTMNTVSTTLKP
ncbi:hypothetical protein BH09PSE2_BH09PSE2_11170 [soil metagenome]